MTTQKTALPKTATFPAAGSPPFPLLAPAAVVSAAQEGAKCLFEGESAFPGGVWQSWSDAEQQLADTLTWLDRLGQGNHLPPNPVRRPSSMERALPEGILPMLQTVAHDAVETRLAELAPLMAGEAVCRSRTLQSSLGRLFREALVAPDEGEVETLLAVGEARLVPLLDRLVPGSRDEEASWRTLQKPGGGADMRRLLMTGLFPYVEPHELGLLLQMTRRLLTLVPDDGPDLQAILGEHLRGDYNPKVDQVDLGMVALTLPVVLGAIEQAVKDDRPNDELESLRDLLVSGLTFGVRTPDEYIAHWIEWVSVARAFGIEAPEDLVGDAFRRYPETVPDLARAFINSGYGDGLLRKTSLLQHANPARDSSGVRGLLRRTPEWRSVPVVPPEGKPGAPDSDPEQIVLTAIYGLLRQMRTPAEPSAADFATTSALLEALKRELPPCPGSADLLSRTECCLREEPANRALLENLAQEWDDTFKVSAWWPKDGSFRVPYASWHHDRWKHPWLKLTEAIAAKLRT